MRHQTIAPRLANGDSRVRDYGRLPEAVKDGLRAIARMEGKSMSWVKEEVIIEFFKLRQPKYRRPKINGKINGKVVPIRKRA